MVFDLFRPSFIDIYNLRYRFKHVCHHCCLTYNNLGSLCQFTYSCSNWANGVDLSGSWLWNVEGFFWVLAGFLVWWPWNSNFIIIHWLYQLSIFSSNINDTFYIYCHISWSNLNNISLSGIKWQRKGSECWGDHWNCTTTRVKYLPDGLPYRAVWPSDWTIWEKHKLHERENRSDRNPTK